MRKAVFLILLLLFTLLVISMVYYVKQPNLFTEYSRTRVKIGSRHYLLYIADDYQKRMNGLSNTDDLPLNQGMAFIFPSKNRYSFWMKDMKYSLDFIFLDDYVVVDLHENLAFDSYPNTLTPRSVVNKVIELNAGEIQKSGIHIGDTISF